MRLRYKSQDGQPMEIALSDKPLTIGRSPDADIVVLDERASRMHCGVRLWDDAYYLKDLKSKNGTYLNNDRVEMAKIKPGDKIRVGTFVISIVDDNAPPAIPGANTAINALQAEMDEEGKGYNTMMREIVAEAESKPLPSEVAPSASSTDKTAVNSLPSSPRPASVGNISFDPPAIGAATESKAAPVKKFGLSGASKKPIIIRRPGAPPKA
jgi:predicted component of type VI protein secretion system